MKKLRKKICVITGSRAEYGLLYWLLKDLKKSKNIDLQLIATGMHLSPEFGKTIDQIKKDGFVVDREIDILLSSDEPSAIAKSCGLCMISFSDAFKELKPDMIVLLGDRFELLSVASTALLMNIPIAHIHGGEVTIGAYDDAIRHSISKMSWLHFVAHLSYKKRLIQIGENENQIFDVGGLGAYGISKIKLYNLKDLEKLLNFKINKDTILITYHPVTQELDSVKQFKTLLNVLKKKKKYRIIFTMPNADNYGKSISNEIKKFVKSNSNRSIWFYSLGQKKYLSLLKYARAAVGNSSSGVLEAPSFDTPTINIGSRQEGRVMAKSIINCKSDSKSINQAFKKIENSNFLEVAKISKNPFFKKNTSKDICKILEEFEIPKNLKKKFYDIQ